MSLSYTQAYDSLQELVVPSPFVTLGPSPRENVTHGTGPYERLGQREELLCQNLGIKIITLQGTSSDFYGQIWGQADRKDPSDPGYVALHPYLPITLAVPTMMHELAHLFDNHVPLVGFVSPFDRARYEIIAEATNYIVGKSYGAIWDGSKEYVNSHADRIGQFHSWFPLYHNQIIYNALKLREALDSVVIS